MPRAVRFDEYGDVDVLDVVDVDRPAPGRGQVLVRVRASGINPGEAAIRQGLMREQWPSEFPSGQGSDFAGLVAGLGEGAEGLDVDERVLGFTDDRSAQAEYVVVGADHLIRLPDAVSFEEGGALFVVGTTAYAAVRAVGAGRGDVLVVSGAAGGVGSLAVQLARDAGATVIGLAGEPHHAWLVGKGVIPVAYGEGVEDRIRAAAEGRPIDAFIDTFGDDYVRLAVDLGVDRDRIDTIINFADAATYGVKTEGNAAAASADVLADLAGRMDRGRLEVPIAAVYPMERVRDAYRRLADRHTEGKIVLTP